MNSLFQYRSFRDDDDDDDDDDGDVGWSNRVSVRPASLSVR